MPLDHEALRGRLIENAGLRCTPQRLAVYDQLSQESASDRRGRLSGGSLDDPQDQPGDRLQSTRSLVAVGVATRLTGANGTASRPVRRTPRTALPFPLSPVRQRARLAHPVRPRSDRQARPPTRTRSPRQGFQVTGYRLELIGYHEGRPLGIPSRHSGSCTQPPREPTPLRGRQREPAMTLPTPSFGPLVDTHAHLDDRRLQDDLEGVLRSGTLCRTGADRRHRHHAPTVPSCSNRTQSPGIFAAVGIQPNHVAEAQTGDWPGSSSSPPRRVVAIGETGLDRYWDRTPFPQQQEWFDRHLGLAQQLGLPVVIHCRDCEPDIIEQLSNGKSPVRGCMHSFTGTVETQRHSSSWDCTSHLPAWSRFRTRAWIRSARPPRCTPRTAPDRNGQSLPQSPARPGLSQPTISSCMDGSASRPCSRFAS